MQYKEEDKKAYLEYYKALRKRTQRPQTFGTWLRSRRGSKGLSRQTRGQLQGLSESDAKELQRFFR